MIKTILMSVVALGCVCQSEPVIAQKSKDTLRVPLEYPIQAISYYLNPNGETSFLTEAVFDNLVAFDEKNFRFEPLLAKSWKQIDDLTLEFQLRDDIKWHDGAKFTADDVVYTLRWVMEAKDKLRFGSNWGFIDKVEKTGPNTVRIMSAQPAPFALARLSTNTAIEAEHAHGKAEDKVVYGATKPVGTGMYKVADLDRNKHLLLELNRDYKHGGSAKVPSNIGRIELIPIPEMGSRLAHFLAGNLDLITELEMSTAEGLIKKPGIELTMSQGMFYRYLAIDAKGRSSVKPLQDVRVRRALMMALNRTDLMTLLAGGREVSTPEAMCWKFQQGCDYSLKPYAYDPAGAKKLLAEAGYPKGFELEITTLVGAASTETATLVADQFRQIGIQVSIQPVSIAAYRKRQTEGKIQALVAGWSAGGLPDTQATIEFIYAAPESRDYTGDTDMQELAAKSLTIMDPEERQKLARQVFDISMDRAYFTPLGPSPAVIVHTADLSIGSTFVGFGISPGGIRWK